MWDFAPDLSTLDWPGSAQTSIVAAQDRVPRGAPARVLPGANLRGATIVPRRLSRVAPSTLNHGDLSHRSIQSRQEGPVRRSLTDAYRP